MATMDFNTLVSKVDTSVTANGCTFTFGYPSQVNANHNNTYPYVILEPPTSVFTNAYDNKEQFTLKFYIYDRQGANTLQVSYRNLQTLLKNIMQSMFLSFEDNMILNGDVRIERINDTQNDRLIGVIVDIPVNVFSNCLLY